MLSVTTSPKPRAKAREEKLKQQLDSRREEILDGPPELREFTLELQKQKGRGSARFPSRGDVPQETCLELRRSKSLGTSRVPMDDPIRKGVKNRSLTFRVKRHREVPRREAEGELWEGLS
mmetsp:Transcript_12744/g.51278  ORF Transcript_12744/g.51278 Transcript_12744/m.51278 type:complete len:120 (-) Transcript_12744:604-963(-)|eukprot:CAMPEP_0113956530 /NCGR_PEP_ID=MMETSP0011_2-20120614/2129_1 /TAXON_ID=101924 /ORGANISM="Rhodosorus marinus" /LENGTH=119 /DNA_ID=CAMNT_0000966719 /DNA_START=109 /DNA_END=468 /DNA_ORIENTATION=+ /assembly_acc=CAM_ASM_000156